MESTLREAAHSTHTGETYEADTRPVRSARSKAGQGGGGRGLLERSRPDDAEGADDAGLVRRAPEQEWVRDLRRIPRRGGASGAPQRTDRRGAHGPGAESVHDAAGDRVAGG